MIRNSNDETNFPRKLLLTNTQVSKICKAFANSSSANMKLLSKMIHSGEILADLIAAIPHVMFLTGKEILTKCISLEPKLAAKATEYYIYKRINELNKKLTSSEGSGITLTNNKMKDIMKVISL